MKSDQDENPLITEAHSGRARKASLDAARGVAVVGMVFTHYVPTEGDGTVLGDLSASLSGFVYGKASALFCILAGISWSLMARRHQAKSSWKMYFLRRALGLAFLGGCLRWLIWPSEILSSFSLFMWLVFPLLACRLYILCIYLLISVLAIIPLNHMFLGYVERDWTANGIFSPVWAWDMHPIRYYFFNGDYPVFPFFGYVLVGVMMGRAHWEIRSRSRLLLVSALLLSCLLSLFQRYIDQHPHLGDVYRVHLLTTWLPTTVMFWLVGLSASLVVLGLLFGIEARGISFKYGIRQWLCQLGRRSLTHYIAHLLLAYPLLTQVWPSWDWSATTGSLFFFVYILGVTYLQTITILRNSSGPFERMIRFISGPL